MAQVGRQAAHFAAAIGNIEVFKLLADTYKVSVNVTDKVFCIIIYHYHTYAFIVYTYVCIHTYVCECHKNYHFIPVVQS